MKKLFFVVVALALVWALAAPASAVDWNFYGSARMATFYTSRDFEDGTNAAGTDDEDDGTVWDLQNNSRIGATVKGDNIRGRFELGLTGNNGRDWDEGGSRSDPKTGDGIQVRNRRIEGWWNFGAGELGVYKGYTPVNQFISTQAFDGDNGLLGIGAFYGLRPDALELAFGKLRIALVDPDAENLIAGLQTTTTIGGIGIGGGDPDSYLPKIEAGWGMSFDQFSFNLMGGFQYYEIEDVVSAQDLDTDDVEVVSWVIGGDASFSFGPAYIRGAVSLSQNPNDAGWFTYDAVGAAVWDGDDDTDDTDVIMGALVAGFKMSDMITFEGGFGVADFDSDVQNSNDTTQWSAYLNATIQLAPGVFIIPEVGYFDYDEIQIEEVPGEDDAGESFYLGAKWQIDF